MTTRQSNVPLSLPSLLCLTAALILPLLSGCSNKSAAQSGGAASTTAAAGGAPSAASGDDAMKQQMTHPQKFDINNVPPDKREMVRAFMNSTKNGPAPPSAAAKK